MNNKNQNFKSVEVQSECSQNLNNFENENNEINFYNHNKQMGTKFNSDKQAQSLQNTRKQFQNQNFISQFNFNSSSSQNLESKNVFQFQDEEEDLSEQIQRVSQEKLSKLQKIPAQNLLQQEQQKQINNSQNQQINNQKINSIQKKQGISNDLEKNQSSQGSLSNSDSKLTNSQGEHNDQAKKMLEEMFGKNFLENNDNNIQINDNEENSNNFNNDENDDQCQAKYFSKNEKFLEVQDDQNAYQDLDNDQIQNQENYNQKFDQENIVKNENQQEYKKNSSEIKQDQQFGANFTQDQTQNQENQFQFINEDDCSQDIQFNKHKDFHEKFNEISAIQGNREEFDDFAELEDEEKQEYDNYLEESGGNKQEQEENNQCENECNNNNFKNQQNQNNSISSEEEYEQINQKLKQINSNVDKQSQQQKQIDIQSCNIKLENQNDHFIGNEEKQSLQRNLSANVDVNQYQKGQTLQSPFNINSDYCSDQKENGQYLNNINNRQIQQINEFKVQNNEINNKKQQKFQQQLNNNQQTFQQTTHKKNNSSQQQQYQQFQNQQSATNNNSNNKVINSNNVSCSYQYSASNQKGAGGGYSSNVSPDPYRADQTISMVYSNTNQTKLTENYPISHRIQNEIIIEQQSNKYSSQSSATSQQSLSNNNTNINNKNNNNNNNDNENNNSFNMNFSNLSIKNLSNNNTNSHDFSAISGYDENYYQEILCQMENYEVEVKKLSQKTNQYISDLEYTQDQVNQQNQANNEDFIDKFKELALNKIDQYKGEIKILKKDKELLKEQNQYQNLKLKEEIKNLKNENQALIQEKEKHQQICKSDQLLKQIENLSQKYQFQVNESKALQNNLQSQTALVNKINSQQKLISELENQLYSEKINQSVSITMESMISQVEYQNILKQKDEQIENYKIILEEYENKINQNHKYKEELENDLKLKYEQQIKTLKDEIEKLRTIYKAQEDEKTQFEKKVVELKENNTNLQEQIKKDRIKYRSLSMQNPQSINNNNNSNTNNSLSQNNTQTSIVDQQEFSQTQLQQKKKKLFMSKKEKEKVKKEINQWVRNFEEKEGRKITNQDKEPIKNLYIQYNSIVKQIKEIESQIQQIQLNQSILTNNTNNNPHNLTSNSITTTTSNNNNNTGNLNLIQTPIQKSPISSNIQQQIQQQQQQQQNNNNNNNNYNQSGNKKSVSLCKNLNINGSFENSNSFMASNNIPTPLHNQPATPGSLFLNSGIMNTTGNSQEIQKIQMEYRQAKNEITLLKNQITKANQSENDTLKGLKMEIKNLSNDKELLKQALLENEKKLQKEFSDKLTILEEKTEKLKDLLKQAELSKEQIQKEAERLKKKYLSEKRQLIQEIKFYHENQQILENKYQEEFNLRKELHNEIQDYKGKIRVYCRIRPLINSEIQNNHQNITTIQDQFSLSLNYANNKPYRQFKFDACFGPDSTQDDITKDTNKLVQSAIDGYNCCIFAYGQTGSGKTYTMQGIRESPGVTPRVVEELYKILQGVSKVNEVNVYVYMVELYQDCLIDLLQIDQDEQNNRKKLEIKEDINGQIYIQNVRQVGVKNNDELNNLLKKGMISRKTGKTDMNEESSRSHLIITINIEIKNHETGIKKVGKLSLVDLAGSERINKSNLNAKQVNEAKAINKSLTALGDVISALTTTNENGQSNHIPYRNNKLTYLMKDSLGGNAKTLMFVNISPADFNFEESKNSLQYASRVKQIKNDIQKQIETREISELNKKYRELNQQNQDLSDQLKKQEEQIQNLLNLQKNVVSSSINLAQSSVKKPKQKQSHFSSQYHSNISPSPNKFSKATPRSYLELLKIQAEFQIDAHNRRAQHQQKMIEEGYQQNIQYQQTLNENKIQMLTQSHKQAIDTLNSIHKTEINALNKEFQLKSKDYQLQIQELEQKIKEIKDENEKKLDHIKKIKGQEIDNQKQFYKEQMEKIEKQVKKKQKVKWEKKINIKKQ